jgi:GTP pyrophosphokinase
MAKFNKNVRHFIKEITTINEIFPIPNTVKAFYFLTSEMDNAHGFTRHDGSDYFVHPIAVAQTLLDYQIIARRLRTSNFKAADDILASALLHDVQEDIDFVTQEWLAKEFSPEIALYVDNLSKRDGEPLEDYLVRVGSSSISSLVKIGDRLNNVSTLSQSSDTHRLKQYKETKEYYLPLIKELRKNYF